MRLPFITSYFFLTVTSALAAWLEQDRDETLLALKYNDEFCIGVDDVAFGHRWELKYCDDHDSHQCWNLKYRRTDDEYFRIHPCDDDDLCVQITGDYEQDKFKLRACASRLDSQYFTYDENDDGELSPKENRRLCAEPKVAKENRLVWLQDCNAKERQSWNLKDFQDDDRCDHVTWREADTCSKKDAKYDCQRCCRSYCDGQSIYCENKCEEDCEDDAGCDDIRRCDYVTWRQADKCKEKDSEYACQRCCRSYCDGQSSYCEDECEEDCEDDAGCDDIRRCDYVNWREADKCSQKGSEYDCQRCCRSYCDGQSSYCEDKCEEDCEDDAGCDDIRRCNYVTSKEAENCSQKDNENSCESCCSYYCDGQSSYCEDKCEEDCEKDAHCDEIRDCDYVEKWKSDVCDNMKEYEWQCNGCCEWYCDRLDDACSDCESKCEKAADCSSKPSKEEPDKCDNVSGGDIESCERSNKCTGCCDYYCKLLNDPCEKCVSDCEKGNKACDGLGNGKVETKVTEEEEEKREEKEEKKEEEKKEKIDAKATTEKEHETKGKEEKKKIDATVVEEEKEEKKEGKGNDAKKKKEEKKGGERLRHLMRA